MMEDYQTTEHVKEEVVDCGFVEVDSQDVHQLCTACLCATRNTRTLDDDDALKQYYMHILTEMQPEPEGGVVVLQSPRVCWECVSQLKRVVRFREQAQDSYKLLHPMLSKCDQEDLDEFPQTSVCRPGRLKTCIAHSINIFPQGDEMQVTTVTKHEDNEDKDYQTTEHVREELVDCGFVEVDSQDVHQLCTACLCATRTTRTLDDGALKQYYMHILIEMQPEPEGGVVVLQSPPRVCWECESHLKRSVHFREQVQDSYKLLHPMLSMCDQEDLDEFLQTSVCRPGRLKTCFAHSINIFPQGDDMQVMIVTKHEDNDDKAALRSLGNDFERHSSTFQENAASTVEEPTESFCDEKYDVCVSEDVVESHPMCNDNLVNYQDYDRNHEQLDEIDIHLREEGLNDIKTINTPKSSHESTGDVNTTFVCDYCQKGFNSKAALERHIATYNIYPHNNKTVPSPCAECAVVLCSDDRCSECPNKLYLLQYKQAKTAEIHSLSNECNKYFSVEANLRREKNVYSCEKPYQCEMCHKSFAQKAHMLSHLRTHTGEKPFQCEMCHKSFARKNHILLHLRTHTGEKPFQCGVCRKSFARLGNLKYHKLIHTGEKPFQCEVCHKSFADKRNLSRHNRIHTGQKPFQCKVCHKSFAHNGHLISHTRTHTGEKPFQCETCHKSFARLGNLKYHTLVHTGEKPFQCEVCYKYFTLKRVMINHMRAHAGEKPFHCKVCHKYFARNGHLIRHTRTHTGQKPYQCKVCHKSFGQNCHLIRHTRTHTGEKPFQCEMCHKSFAQKSDMLLHLRIHTGEKPFQCAACHKSYTSRQALMYHIRTHATTTNARRLTSL